jgi:hypothetical protein
LIARLAAALALVLAAAPAAPQGFDGTQPLDAYTSLVLSDGRIMGLGGAFVGVGEGPAAARLNPAAVAQRDRHLDRPWDVSGVLTWFVPDVTELGGQDLGNDGALDGSLDGAGNLLLGFGAQAGRLGVGMLIRLYGVSAPTAQGAATVGTTDVALSAGWSGLRDALVVGVSLAAPHGFFEYAPEGVEPVELEYERRTFRAGVLLRPRRQPFRVGLSFEGAGKATPIGDRGALPVATPSAFLFPWVVSAGASAWIGPNARRYNEPPPFALSMHPEWGEGPPLEPGRSPVLVTAQLDLVGPTDGALALESALFPGAAAVPSGERPSLVPRAGVEWEARRRVVRLRAGSYLEPSRSGAAPRLHACFGAELRIPFWPWDLQASFGGDVARDYTNVGLSLGFWSDLGPLAPHAEAPGAPPALRAAAR